MYSIGNGALNIYSMLILIYIYLRSDKHQVRRPRQTAIFNWMVLTCIILLFIDSIARMDGHPGTVYEVLNRIGNFLLFLFNPLLGSLWVAYVYEEVFQDARQQPRYLYPVLALLFLNASLTVASLFTGWFYIIDSANIYRRGPYFLVTVSFSLGMLLIAAIMTFIKRKTVEKNYFLALLLFPLPSLAAVILQSVFYGVSLILNAIALSLFIVFLDIQEKHRYRDYLTGVNNRQKLDLFLRSKARLPDNRKGFSAIMLDVDHFKHINDTYGHAAGDEALRIVAETVSKCVRINDFVSRYGGDEFCLVLDTTDTGILETIVERIRIALKAKNLASDLQYELSVSIGYAVYDRNIFHNEEALLQHIDKLMYEDKQRLGISM